MMKRSCISIWLAGLLSAHVAHAQPAPPPPLAANQPAAPELNLAVGENRVIPAHDVKSYSEGASGIAEVKLTPSGSQFVVVGQKAGATTLLLIKRDGTETTWNINVFARPLQTVATELNELVGDQTGIAVKKVGARFFIEGGVSSPADLERIQHIASLYNGQVESLVVLGGAAAVRKINIRVDFYFVQYDKTRSRQLGIDMPTQIGGGVLTFAYDILARATTTATAALSRQPLPALDVAARNGWAKVVKHATVITANGASATFSSGGVQNFSITGLANSIHPIRFGTDVNVLPRFDPVSREIAVEIHADVADLTSPTGATNLPGQNISKLDTNVALKLGQSVVLSGIRTRDEQYTTGGLPWLSEIPVLGLLFGSQDVRMHEVEGALFIVPSVLDTSTARADELIRTALHEYDEFSGDMDEVTPFEERPQQVRQ